MVCFAALPKVFSVSSQLAVLECAKVDQIDASRNA